ncbi:MAG: glycosyltransferase family 4 protein [Rhodocyclaceae bacterium]|nr:glycosyltransferase family 4 protein [Rhodocyclaceae bacterium]
MPFAFAALLVSFLVTLVLVRAGVRAGIRSAGRALLDTSRRNPWTRDTHLHGWGRTGGLGVFLGLAVALALRWGADHPEATVLLGLLSAASVVFLAGLADDFTQRVRGMVRLLAAIASAWLAGTWVGAWVPRLDVPVLDALLTPGLALLLSCLLVAGITNAFNIIDGFNGLAGGVATIILLGIAYVAFKVSDTLVVAGAITAIGAIAGFLFFNFPRGMVFLGDGGAYFLGFWIGELLILLVARNPEVSAWFPLMLCAYPTCELLFSIYRRAFVRRAHPGMPDIAHLHHLIYMRLVRWLAGGHLPERHMIRNSLTAPYLWAITSIAVAPAVVFWESTHLLQLGALLFAAGYVYAYLRIVRFRSPRWWVLRNSPPSTEKKTDA